jgi:hypothetical protein
MPPSWRSYRSAGRYRQPGCRDRRRGIRRPVRPRSCRWTGAVTVARLAPPQTGPAAARRPSWPWLAVGRRQRLTLCRSGPAPAAPLAINGPAGGIRPGVAADLLRQLAGEADRPGARTAKRCTGRPGPAEPGPAGPGCSLADALLDAAPAQRLPGRWAELASAPRSRSCATSCSCAGRGSSAAAYGASSWPFAYGAS